MADSLSWWQTFNASVRRALGLSEPLTIEEVKPGADWSAGAPIQQAYNAEDALSAVAAFVWVRACADAICSDLAGRPLAVYRGRGKDAVRLPDHDVLALLDQPTTDMPRELWERQAVLYWLLAGNAYALMVGVGKTPVSLPLLHPERTKPVPTEYGGVAQYVYGLEQKTAYSPERVLHIRGPSWQSGPAALLGEGLIRTLHNDLTADLAAQKLNTKHAQRGRPTAVISPKGDDVWDEDTRRKILAAYTKQTETGGTLVLGNGVQLDLPTFTPRDLEFGEQRTFTRQGILAAFAVPPARLGLETANYATQTAQMKTYWQCRQADARLIDAAYTRVARMFDPSLTIRHDFSDIEELQESRTSRLDRVVQWVTVLGADPAEAAAYEGFDDAPVSAQPQPAAEPAPTPTLMFPAVHVARAAFVAPTDEAGREAVWRTFLQDVHTPSERALIGAIGKELRAQRGRILTRLSAKATPSRGLIEDLFAELWPDIEDQALRVAGRRSLEVAIRAAFDAAAVQTGTLLSYDASAAHATLTAGLDMLSGPVSRTTKAAVLAALEDGLATGATIDEIANRIKLLPAFGPARALAVGRTETTRATNGGANDAYHAALVEGVNVRSQWLSARDGEVRDAHGLLDGQVVRVGERFTVPAESPIGPGRTARYPGDFDLAALVVNCRCTTIPVIEAA